MSVLLIAAAPAAAGKTSRPEAACDSAPHGKIVRPGAPGNSSILLTPTSASTSLGSISEADVRFMQGMVLHHAQAVEMATLLQTRTTNQKMRALGERIRLSQLDEIAFMAIGFKSTAGLRRRTPSRCRGWRCRICPGCSRRGR